MMKVLSLFDGMACGMIAFKKLGNGWTVDVIAHILSSLENVK